MRQMLDEGRNLGRAIPQTQYKCFNVVTGDIKMFEGGIPLDYKILQIIGGEK